MISTELESFGIISNIDFVKKKNCHSSCVIKIIVTDLDHLSSLNQMVNTIVSVSNNRIIYLYGCVDRISIKHSFLNHIACVYLKSLSCCFDEEIHYRLFQNTQKTFKNLISSLSKDYITYKILDKAISEQKENQIILQRAQSNFEFSIKIAKKLGLNVFVSDRDKNHCNIYIAKYIDTLPYTFKNDQILNKSIHVKKNKTVIKIKSREFIELGSKINIDEKDYVITKVSGHYSNGISLFKYKLELVKKSLASKANYKNNKYCFLGRASVVDVDDPENLGRIRVKFLDFEDSANENQYWVPYLCSFTEKDQGIVLIPGKGEIVETFLFNGNCYSLGALREIPLNEELNNVEHRSLMTYNKKLVFSRDEVKLEAFGYSLMVTDKNLSIKDEINSISINKDGYILKTKKADILGDERLVLRSSPSTITLSKNSITAETSKFDVK